jgi:elongation factor P
LTNASEIQPGNIVVRDGDLWKVLDAHRASPGAGAAAVHAVLRCVRTGVQEERRFRAADRLELATVETRELQYLYAQGELHHFMDTRTFEQSVVDGALLGEALPFLRENDVLRVESVHGRLVGVVLPETIELEVTATGPGAGEDISNVFKDAMLETGLTIRVPLSVEMGERVRVDTRTGQFVDRVS